MPSPAPPTADPEMLTLLFTLILSVLTLTTVVAAGQVDEMPPGTTKFFAVVSLVFAWGIVVLLGLSLLLNERVRGLETLHGLLKLVLVAFSLPGLLFLSDMVDELPDCWRAEEFDRASVAGAVAATVILTYFIVEFERLLLIIGRLL